MLYYSSIAKAVAQIKKNLRKIKKVVDKSNDTWYDDWVADEQQKI